MNRLLFIASAVWPQVTPSREVRMIQGHVVTLEIDTNSLHGDRISTYILDDEVNLLYEIEQGQLVRAVAEEGHGYLARVEAIDGRQVRLTLLEPWSMANGNYAVNFSN